MNTTVNVGPKPQNRLTETTHTMTTWDGAEIFYRAWIPTECFGKAVILFHRGHEHSGRWTDIVESLNLPNTAVFAWDARGHGCSPGERGYAPNLASLVKDVDTFVHFICSEYNLAVQDVVVVAHSVAAVLVSAWLHDYAVPIRGVVLATPAFQVKLYVPGARAGLRVLQKIKPKASIKSYVGSRLLTHDQAEAEKYDTDPRISRAIPANILLDLFTTSERVVADAGAITTSILLLVAGSDAVVHTKPQQEFFKNLSSPIKEMELYDDFSHSIFHEAGRELPIARTQEFISRLFLSPPPKPALLHADESGFTRTEFDKLKTALPSACPRQLSFSLQRASMKTIGRLSHGIRVGWQSGFDSGESLDYVYENQPRGITPLGRWIDRAYLDSIGWRGIRKRKEHLQEALRAAIKVIRADGDPVKIVDIAAGPGRYLLEVLATEGNPEVSAVLRDRSKVGLEHGRTLAKTLNIRNVRYEAGDAFDRNSLAAITPRPNIAVVSGLYELFPSNDIVLTSLRGLASVVQPGGYLIYTNQPWHPQVEMIARVLTNRERQPWIMRRRTQAEMDELVRAAGFEKVSMQIDEFGIFTVSVARRA